MTASTTLPDFRALRLALDRYSEVVERQGVARLPELDRWYHHELPGVFEEMAHDLRALLRRLEGRHEEPSAVVLDSRALQSSPESGGRAGYDGSKRRKGSKVHVAVDTLGHLLALHVTPANEQDRSRVAELATRVQEVTADTVKWPLWTRATRASRQRKTRPRKASTWKW